MSTERHHHDRKPTPLEGLEGGMYQSRQPPARLDDRAAVAEGAFANPGYRRIFGVKGNMRVKLTRGEQEYVEWLKAKTGDTPG